MLTWVVKINVIYSSRSNFLKNYLNVNNRKMIIESLIHRLNKLLFSD